MKTVSKPEAYKEKKPPLIEGVVVKTLRTIPDERGRLMEILRSDWPEYDSEAPLRGPHRRGRFGQAYMTTVYPGVTKAWHYHKKQVDRMACVSGMAKMVLYDARKGSKTRGVVNEFFMGIYNPVLVVVPALVYHGFKCVSERECIFINVPNALYNYEEPDEFRLPAHTPRIPYDWRRRDG